MENGPPVKFGHSGQEPVVDPLLKLRERSAIETARKFSLAQLFSKPVRDRLSVLEGYKKDGQKLTRP